MGYDKEKVGTVVLGVIGSDIHSIGNRIMEYALKEEGFNVINLGVQVPLEEFIKAAIESNADAILIGSLYGHAMMDCEGIRDKCIEAGLGDIILYIGGNLTTDYTKPWEEIEQTFKAMGFDRVFRSGVLPSEVIKVLREDIRKRRERRGKC